MINLKRILRWRLKTLLILMAVLAVALAIWAQLIVPYDRQQTARESLADVTDEMLSEAAWPEFLSSWDPDRFVRVVSFRANQSLAVGDKEITPVGDMAFLKSLRLNNTNVGDLSARQIGRLKRLERLFISESRFTDEALVSISHCYRLQELDLRNTCVSDSGLKALVDLPKLRTLSLGTTICGPGLEAVAKIPTLTTLDLSASGIYFDDLSYLAGSPIKELQFTNLVPARICNALTALPKLRTFNSRIVQADDRSAEVLSNCQHLKAIDVVGVGITDQATATLIQMPGLRSLKLHGALTDESLAIVESAKQLTFVSLAGRFSVKAIERLAARRPKLFIEIHTALHDYREIKSKFENLTIQSLIFPSSSGIVRTTVLWPATLADVTALPDLEARNAPDVRLTNPPTIDSAFESDFQHEWSLAGIENLSHIKVFWTPRVKPNELSMLGKLPLLESVVLQDDRLTDNELQHIQLPEQCRLVIQPSRVTRSGLKAIKQRFPNAWTRENGHGSVFDNRRWHSSWTGQGSIDDVMRFPELDEIQFDDIRSRLDLTPLTSMPKLNKLSIISFRGDIANAPVFSLAKQLTGLKELTFVMPGFNNRDLERLQQFPDLERLVLRDTSVTDNGLAALVNNPKLNDLSLKAKYFTGRGMKHFAQLPNLRRLEFRSMQLEDRHFRYLHNVQSLRELVLHYTNIGDEACRHLAGIPHLQTLDLGHTTISDAGLAELSKCPELKTIAFGSTFVTGEGLLDLASGKALRVIDLGRTEEISSDDILQVKAKYRNVTIE